MKIVLKRENIGCNLQLPWLRIKIWLVLNSGGGVQHNKIRNNTAAAAVGHQATVTAGFNRISALRPAPAMDRL